MRQTRHVWLTLAIVIPGIVPGLAWSGAGDLDPTFGADGMVLADLRPYSGASASEALAVAMQPDGKMVVGGLVRGLEECDFLLMRYDANGRLDTGFAGGGVQTFDIANDDMAFAVAVGPDGNIFLAGSACGTTCEFALVGINSDGGWGFFGPLTTAFGPGDAYGRAVAVQPDGKVVLAGYTYNGADGDVAVARYLLDGSLDPGFGLGGKVRMGTPSKDEGAMALAIQADGKIVVGGDSSTSTTSEFLLIRYLPDGTLDPSFGTGGVVTTPLSSGTFGGTGNFGAFVTAVTLQADGKIVACGASYQDIDYDFAVARYLPDGTLDASFGAGGKVTTLVGAGEDQPHGMTLDPDTGAITLAGYTCSDSACTPGRIGVVRYRTDGSLDPSFGTGGIVTTTIGPDVAADDVALLAEGRTVVVGTSLQSSGYVLTLVGYREDGSIEHAFGSGTVTTAVTPEDFAYGVVVQPDGKVVVTGTGASGSGTVVELVRYGVDGTLDPIFGAGGMVMTDVGPYTDEARAVALQNDGKLVVAGSSFNGASNDFLMARYTAEGALDPAFGAGGLVATPFGANSAQGRSVALQADGKIVVAGTVDLGSAGDFALVRYQTDGSLDPSFGLGGKVTTSVTPGFDEAAAVAVQTDGKIVVAGTADVQGFAVVRYSGDGSLDTDFGSGGTAITLAGFGANFATALLVQPDGKIVVGGESDHGSLAFTLVRYALDGSLDTTFGSGGVVTTDIGSDDSQVTALALQSAGKIVAVGYGRNAEDGDFIVARYDSDGDLDLSFGAAGIAEVNFGPLYDDIALAAAVAPDGKLVVAGRSANNGDRHLAVARYLMSACGNGALEPGEQCDDGNVAIADSCDALCRNEESVSAAVSAGGTVTSDSEADGATPADVVETEVTSPNSGAIAILETSPASPGVAGFALLDLAVNVTAPPATAAAPLVLTFRLDASAVPAGQDEQGIAIFRNGALVPECSGATGEAAPDPCIANRAQLGDGDAAITVLSSQASWWEFAVAACTPRKPGVCRVPAVPGAGQLLLKRGTSPASNRLAWKWAHGPGSLADLGDPTTSSDYVLCLIDSSGDVAVPLTAVPAGANGICAGKPCWSASGTSGFRYTDKNAASGGLRRLTVKSSKKGEANLNAQARGAGLQFPALPLQLPVRVQLQRQGGDCWEATYSGAHASKNDEYQFKGKAD